MKKGYLFLVLFIIVLMSHIAVAQDKETHYYHIWTFKASFPEGGSYAERDSIFQLWVDKVQNKNEYLISVRHLVHGYGADSRDWLMIWELKKFEDIPAAMKRNVELFKEAWPDQEERKKYNKINAKYFGDWIHSDEIYTEIMRYRK